MVVRVRMRTLLVAAILAIVLFLGIFLYRSQSGISTNVTPDAQRAIEKAKGR